MRETNWFEGRGVDEKFYERCYWRRLGFAVFVLVAVAVVAALSGCATGAASDSQSPYDGPNLSITSGQGDSVRLTKEPCPLATGWLRMARAEMLYQGKQYQACWILVGNAIVVFDSNGDVTPIPAQAFKPEVPL